MAPGIAASVASVIVPTIALVRLALSHCWNRHRYSTDQQYEGLHQKDQIADLEFRRS
jgi:hypothetical protein